MKALVGIWREACRHIEIDTSIGTMAGLLEGELPLSRLMLRRIDVAKRRAMTVADGQLGREPHSTQARTDYTADDMEVVLGFFGEGRVRRGRARGKDKVIDLLTPADVRGDVILGPLLDEQGPAGVFILVASEEFTTPHVELASALCDPFTVALGNDRRFHELAALREKVEADNRALLSRLERQDIADTVVGSDAGLAEVMERIEQVAPTDAPVLVLGETGSGKEVVARTIHARSRRSAGPLVRVNCGAIPAELVDSELFGHERGSFTGAIQARQGWFERANKGTLFLDEIGELPLAAQVRLLRAISEGTIERVGGQRPIEVDVRIVAATHRDLEAMVREGSFRQDVWYRIAVFPIRLPPLRDRLQDVPALAAHFAWRAGKRLGGVPLAPTPRDIDLLVRYAWPGNVRELAAVIERAAILGNAKRLEVAAALGVSASAPSERPKARPYPVADDHDADEPLDKLDDAIRRHIRRALDATHGKIEGKGGAAELLAVNPHTLRSRMRKLRVDWSRHR